MRISGGKGFIVREVLLLMAVLAMIVFMCRLWPILLLMIIGLFVAMIVLLFRATSEPKPQPVEPKPIPAIHREPTHIPTQNDVYTLAYSVILRRISEIVRNRYPQARWIWESSNARNLIEKGEDVYILLNRAGGYNRAKVIIVNLQVTDIKFDTPVVKTVIPYMDSIALDDTSEDDLEDVDDELPENYELVAFEWVEAHIMELNNRCNEALGEGKKFVLITADELPAKESWIDVCKQLQKNEIENLECVPDGIQINLTH